MGEGWLATMIRGLAKKKQQQQQARKPYMQKPTAPPQIPTPRQPAPENPIRRGPSAKPIIPTPRTPVLGSMKKGGTARKPGNYRLHGGERAAKRSGQRGGGRC